MNRLRLLVRPFVLGLTAAVLAACGSHTDIAGPGPDDPSDEPPAAPAIDWAALGANRIVLGLRLPGSGGGLYRYDGGSRTAQTLWSDPGLDVAVSPDAAWVTYRKYTDQTSLYDVYAARVDGSSERRLSDVAGNSEQGLAWRRDGRLVFTYREGGRCCTDRVAEADPAAGTVSRWDPPNWPDDASYWSTSSHVDFGSDNSVYTTWSVIEGGESFDALVHRSRARADTLLTAEDSNLGFWSPALSPGETLLAFEETLTVPSGGPGTHVYTRLQVLDLVGGGITTLVDTGALTDGSIGRLDICWTADGSTLVYTLWTGTGRELWAISAEGGDPSLILDGVEITSLACIR